MIVERVLGKAAAVYLSENLPKVLASIIPHILKLAQLLIDLGYNNPTP